MSGVVQVEFGGSSNLRFVGDLPKPRVGPGEVLIKIVAAGINPVDWKIREGFLKGMLETGGGRIESGLVLGWECSGVVEGCGWGVNQWKAGDEVFCRPAIEDWGCYCEYVCVPARLCAAKPANISHEEAAGVGLAALTAFQCLHEDVKIKAGEQVLIHAGSGAVGAFAIQIAKAAGAIVTTTCSAKNFEYCTSLGAAKCIDYKSADFAVECADKMDVVFDMVGGDALAKSVGCLKPSGGSGR